MNTHKLKLICSVALATTILTSNVHAQQRPVLNAGDAVVTGFSGTAPQSPSNPTPSIDLDGPSAQIMSLTGLAQDFLRPQ